MSVPSLDSRLGATASLLVVLLCAFALAVGCGGDERLGGTSNDGEEDAGVGADAEDDDTGGGEEDAGSDAGGEDDTPLPEGRSAFKQCAAAGEATGGGYSVVQCTAPVEHQGQVAEGGGYRLEQRSFRWVAP